MHLECGFTRARKNGQIFNKLNLYDYGAILKTHIMLNLEIIYDL